MDVLCHILIFFANYNSIILFPILFSSNVIIEFRHAQNISISRIFKYFHINKDTFTILCYATQNLLYSVSVPLFCHMCYLAPICERKGSIFRRACRQTRKRRFHYAVCHSFSQKQKHNIVEISSN